MGWVEAAWTVKRIMQQLNFDEKINQYTQDVNTLIQDIEELSLEFNTLYGEGTDLHKDASDINNAIQEAQVKIDSLLDAKLAFIASKNNNNTPINENNLTFGKDTVWFIDIADN